MKPWKDKNLSRRIFNDFLSRVLPVFVLPVMVMLAIVVSSGNLINQQMYARNLAILQNSAETVERTFGNMDNLILYLDKNAAMNNFLTAVDPVSEGATTIDMLQAQSDIKALTTANDIIKNIQFYSMKTDMLIDATTSAVYLDRYYSHEYLKGIPFDAWRDQFLRAPHAYRIFRDVRAVANGQETRRILYAKSLPLSEPKSASGTVIIYVDEEYLMRQFQEIPYHQGGFLQVQDEAGQTILSDNQTGFDDLSLDKSLFEGQNGYFIRTLHGRKMFMTYHQGDGKKWHFIAAVPVRQVLQPIASIRFFACLLVLATLLAGGYLVYLSVSRLSRPISHVFELFAGKGRALSYNDFEYEVSRLVASNEHMKETLQALLPELKTSVFHHLLIGQYHDEETIRHNLEKINIPLDADRYVVLIASINDLNTDGKLDEIGALKLYVHDVLTRHFNNVQGIYTLDFERTVLLLACNGADDEKVRLDVEKTSNTIVAQFMSDMMLSVSFAGDTTDDVRNIPASFIKAYAAIQYRKKTSHTTVQWYVTPDHDGQSGYNYPVVLESQLIAAATMGNTARTSELLLRIDELNRHVLAREGGSALYGFLLVMNATRLRILNESGHIPQRIAGAQGKIETGLETKEDLTQTYFLIKETIRAVTLHNKDAQGQDGSTQHAKILRYIDEHYTDPQLSLSRVADVFHITEVYLSHLFKVISGENYSKYVERLRLEHARDLMHRGFKVNEAAQLSGYNSPQVFRRAYKRVVGHAPSDSPLRESDPASMDER